MSKNKKKLIIGVKAIKGANVCVDWLEPLPTIGDFHETYIFLPSLDKKILGKIVSGRPSYFEDFRQELLEALKAELTIYLITAPEVNDKGISNYSLLPFSLSRKEKKVETFKEDELSGYYANVGFSQGYFEWRVDNSFLNANLTSNDKIRFSWRIHPFLESLHNKLISFSVRLTAETYEWEYRNYRWKTLENYGGSIIIAPPTTKIDPIKGLETLLKDEESEGGYEKPEWFEKIKLPEEEELTEKLKVSSKKKAKYEKEIKDVEDKLAEIEKHKWILKLKEKPLEKAVDRAFEFLGIPLAKGRLYQEDRWFEFGDNRIPVEIKGHENAIRRRDIRQIIDRTNEAENKIGKTAGILIVNPYCDEDPTIRKASFENGGDNIIEKAIAFEVILIDTLTLFKCIKNKLNGYDAISSALKQKLITSKGVLDLETIKIPEVKQKDG